MSASTVSVLFVVALLAMLVVRLWLSTRQIRHIARHRQTVPAAFASTVSLQAHQRAADYSVARVQFDLLATAWQALLLLGWTLLGGLDTLNRLVSQWIDPVAWAWASQLVLVCAFGLIGSLLDLPWDAWRTFHIEQSHGFNHTTPRLWWRDHLLGAAIGLVVMVPLAGVVLWLMAASAHWWAWTLLVLGVFVVLMQFIYPTLIAPLFNRFEPLADESLRQRVEQLMQRCGFRSKGCFVMDGSRRSAHANAYFTGWGSSKRVVFFDTLLNKLAPTEVEAVLAHELGHFSHRHVVLRMVAMLVTLGLTLAALAWMSRQLGFFVGLGVTPSLTTPNDALTLILAMLVGPVVGFFFQPLAAAASRRQERQADAFACRHSDARALAAALLRLYEDNASTLTPDPLYAGFHYSHPPAATRLAQLMAAQPARA